MNKNSYNSIAKKKKLKMAKDLNWHFSKENILKGQQAYEKMLNIITGQQVYEKMLTSH